MKQKTRFKNFGYWLSVHEWPVLASAPKKAISVDL